MRKLFPCLLAVLSLVYFAAPATAQTDSNRNMYVKSLGTIPTTPESTQDTAATSQQPASQDSRDPLVLKRLAAAAAHSAPTKTEEPVVVKPETQPAAEVNNSTPAPTAAKEEPATPEPQESHAQPAHTPSPGTPTNSDEYVLAPGDHINLIVYGEQDLSGDYVVSDTGFMNLPLIGTLKAKGNNKRQMEEAISARLTKGYMKDPKVSVQLLYYRPFFILGEVAKPGSYQYVDGMNILNAVALAGGYTYRASTSRIKIIRASDTEKKENSAEETESVKPGDIIKIPERYF